PRPWLVSATLLAGVEAASRHLRGQNRSLLTGDLPRHRSRPLSWDHHAAGAGQPSRGLSRLARPFANPREGRAGLLAPNKDWASRAAASSLPVCRRPGSQPQDRPGLLHLKEIDRDDGQRLTSFSRCGLRRRSAGWPLLLENAPATLPPGFAAAPIRAF